MAPERWLPFLAAAFILGALLDLPILSAFSAALAVLVVVVSFWHRHALDQVFYIRKPHYRKGFPGETLDVTVEVENRKLLPLSWLRVEDPWPHAVGPEDESVLAPSHIPDMGLLTNVFSLRWFERARRRYKLVLRKRGMYKLGPPRLQSGDLFGIYEDTRVTDSEEFLTVFPEILPLEKLGLEAEDPFGEKESRRRLFEDPTQPMGVRDYRPDDGFRRVHWPATARTGEMKVKIYQPVSAQVTVICLNVATFEIAWEGYNPELLEALISTAATLAYHGIEDGYQVGLISNGCLAHSDQSFRIPPGRSPQQLGKLLGVLAAVTPLVTAPFEMFLLREMPRVHYGASLAVVTASIYPALIETLLDLKRRGRLITVLNLGEPVEEFIPGIKIINLDVAVAAKREAA
ncbi:MAG: DUF58 domain-containing protein [Anaerolineales bacterium]|nr:DUF58 domain-containing protein [Anaerolineales bacterium]